MPFEIVRNDISNMDVDSIVNPTNINLIMGGGVSSAIAKRANDYALIKECEMLGHCDIGKSVITKGYKLKAKYIIHTVGPKWEGGNNNELELLKSCYISSLKLAKEYKLESIAFPLISSGLLGYPKEKALKIAIATITDFILENDMLVYLVVYDKKSFVISEKLSSSITKYIDDRYVREHLEILEERYEIRKIMHMEKSARSLMDVVSKLDESFSTMLLRLIDESGMDDVRTYKKANINRKLFSKIRCTKDYKPKKTTAIAFAIALELNLDDTKDLISRAGYALSHSNVFDIIIEYFITEGIYNIFEINEALFEFDQITLG